MNRIIMSFFNARKYVDLNLDLKKVERFITVRKRCSISFNSNDL